VHGGGIRTLTVPHFFLSLRAGKKTGIAVFERDDVVKKVYIKDGDVLFASSNVDDDRLGEFMLRVGKLTAQQYDASVELMKKTGKKQGVILIELGFITPQTMMQVVRDQITHIIQGLFAWREGSCRFEEGPLPLNDIIPLQMSLGNLILSGVRRLEWEMVRDSLPPAGTVLRPATDPIALFQAADLSANQKAVLALIDGKRTIKDICSLSQAGDFYTLKVLFIFLALRMVEVGEITTEEDRDFALQAVRQAVTAEAKKPDAAASSPAMRNILKALEEQASQDNYEVLGVSSTASLQEVQAAYLGLARLYHPDRSYEPGMSDMKPALEKLFNRVTAAFNAIKDRSTRSEFAYLSNQGKVKVKASRRTIADEERPDENEAAAAEFKKGLEAFEMGSFWTALEAFKKVSSLDPQNVQSVYYQAMCLAQMPGKYYDAEETFKKAIALDPSQGDHYVELGHLYMRRGLKPRAIAILEEALQFAPESERVQSALRILRG
jgi:tetratricopeptide (TPR) repeat protein